MPRPVGKLRILLSSRVLFNLETAEQIREQDGHSAYADYIRGRGKYAADFDSECVGRKLSPGPAWHLAESLAALNKKHPGLVEIDIVCKDGADTALTLFRNIDISGLDVNRRLVTNGRDLICEDLSALDPDMFLCRDTSEIQKAIDMDIAAAMLNPHPDSEYSAKACGDKVHLWFDGDAVAFGSSAERVCKEKGLEDYYKHEFNAHAKPIESGPFTRFLAKISHINNEYDRDESPFVLSMLTARGRQACARALMVADHFNIDFNGGMYFMEGADKSEILKHHQPDMYFDDQQVHLEKSAFHCATGHVAYKTGSAMDQYLRAEQNRTGKVPFTK